GTCTDVTKKAGLAGKGWGGDVAVFDYNEDGHLDVLVTCMFGASQLYKNNGDGTFTDVTRQTLGKTSWGGLGAKAFTSKNDGRLDLLIVDMHSDMWMGLDYAHRSEEIAEENAGKKFPWPLGPLELTDEGRLWLRTTGKDVLFGNTFFKNLGKGRFQECCDKVGLETFWPWGIATGDFDNDGLEDVFLPSGMGYPFYYWPNTLLMNNGNGTFTDRAAEAGIEPPPRRTLPVREDRRPEGRPLLPLPRRRGLRRRRSAGPGGQQLQRPGLLLPQSLPQEELGGVPPRGRPTQGRAARDAGQQPGRGWCSGLLAPGQGGDGAAGARRRRLPVPVVADAPLRPGPPHQNRPRRNSLAQWRPPDH